MIKKILCSAVCCISVCYGEEWNISKLDGYFNNLGDFYAEVDIILPGRPVLEGVIKIRRPILKIEYKNGNTLVVNGNNIEHYNKKLNEVSKHKKNPFSILLKNEINLKRDAEQIAIEQTEREVICSFKPKNLNLKSITVSFNKRKMQISSIGVSLPDDGGYMTMMIKNIKKTISDSNEKLLDSKSNGYSSEKQID